MLSYVIKDRNTMWICKKAEGAVDGFDGALRNSKSNRRNERGEEKWPRLNVAAAEKGFSRFSVSREGRK